MPSPKEPAAKRSSERRKKSPNLGMKARGGKPGPLSQEEKDFIDKHRERMTAEQMAGQLDRNPQAVIRYLKRTGALQGPARREMLLADQLETRPEWANFREQFTDKELDHFKYRYVQLMGQFRDDINPTDEMQIFQVISLDILVQRIMREQKEINEDMSAYHRDIDRLHDDLDQAREAMDIQDEQRIRDEIKSLEFKYTKGQEQLRNLSQRYESYMMRQSAMLKELKATRDQRIKIAENSRQSFLGYLRYLQEEDNALAAGREAELMRLAAEAERRRLLEPHVFPDGVTDQPLLVPEEVRDY